MKVFEPKLISSLREYAAKKLLNDFIAGVIVAIIALPRYRSAFGVIGFNALCCVDSDADNCRNIVYGGI